MSERARRLYEELTPVPTRKNSIRFISTYAGWTEESLLLEELYLRVFDRAGNVKPGVNQPLPGLPVFTIGDLFTYWDHEPRMPWQTPEYYESQRADLRLNTYLRLHENRWVSNESQFFEDMGQWDACVDSEHRPPAPNPRLRLWVGADASIKKDRSAVCSIYRAGNMFCLGPYATWQPSKAEPMDLEESMEKYIETLAQNYELVEVRYDPFQFHRSATTLAKEGINMVEYPQTVANMTDAG